MSTADILFSRFAWTVYDLIPTNYARVKAEQRGTIQLCSALQIFFFSSTECNSPRQFCLPHLQQKELCDVEKSVCL